MEKFPFLSLVVKHGVMASGVVAVLAALFALALAWPFWAAASLVPAIVLGVLVLVVARSFVELVVLITEMLLPHE